MPPSIEPSPAERFAVICRRWLEERHPGVDRRRARVDVAQVSYDIVRMARRRGSAAAAHSPHRRRASGAGADGRRHVDRRRQPRSDRPGPRGQEPVVDDLPDAPQRLGPLAPLQGPDPPSPPRGLIVERPCVGHTLRDIARRRGCQQCGRRGAVGCPPRWGGNEPAGVFAAARALAESRAATKTGPGVSGPGSSTMWRHRSHLHTENVGHAPPPSPTAWPAQSAGSRPRSHRGRVCLRRSLSLRRGCATSPHPAHGSRRVAPGRQDQRVALRSSPGARPGR